MREMVLIKNNECKFKYRVSGLLVSEDKLLTVDMDNSGFLCLPGGYVEIGEDSKTSIIREMEEETKYKVVINKLVSIVENFFIDKKGDYTHEIALYYLLEISNDNIGEINNYSYCENDNGNIINHNFHWINLADIKKLDFRPNILKEKLSKEDFTFEHFIYKEK